MIACQRGCAQIVQDLLDMVIYADISSRRHLTFQDADVTLTSFTNETARSLAVANKKDALLPLLDQYTRRSSPQEVESPKPCVSVKPVPRCKWNLFRVVAQGDLTKSDH